MTRLTIAFIVVLLVAPGVGQACDYQAELTKFNRLLAEQSQVSEEFDKSKKACLSGAEQKGILREQRAYTAEQTEAWNQAKGSEASGDMKAACDALAKAQKSAMAKRDHLKNVVDKCAAKQ